MIKDDIEINEIMVQHYTQYYNSQKEYVDNLQNETIILDESLNLQDKNEALEKQIKRLDFYKSQLEYHINEDIRLKELLKLE